MQTTDHAMTIDRATQALYATASEPYRPRAVKMIVVMMVVAVVLLAMAPIVASSMRPSSEESTTASVSVAQQPATATAPAQTTPVTPVASPTP
jgi:flagellar basal body-associated protein FliL